MISSELPEILGMSDRIAVMHGGRDRAASLDDRRDAGERMAARGRVCAAGGSQLGLMTGSARSVGRARHRGARGCVLAVAAPGFFARDNLRDLFLANLPVLIVALGMTLVILTGQIDISVGSQFAICGVVAGLLAKAGLPMPVVALAACARRRALGASTARSSPTSASRRSW